MTVYFQQKPGIVLIASPEDPKGGNATFASKERLRSKVRTVLDPFSLPRLFPVVLPPEPKPDWALFFDLDGTLLDIASSPGGVTVPDDLVEDLRAAYKVLDGAMAIVSGRPLNEIDSLLAPFVIPVAGEHGAVVRMPSGQINGISERVPVEWSNVLSAALSARKGVWVETKVHSVVVHYRHAPLSGWYCRRLCEKLIRGSQSKFEVLRGKMAVEIRPKAANKGRAVEVLMKTKPFLGRKPVFVGDDVTDHDGFRAAHRLGGLAIDVSILFLGVPGEVRRWLKSFRNVSS